MRLRPHRQHRAAPRPRAERPYYRRVNRYVLRGGQEGYDRLQLLASIRRPDTAELFRLIGVRPRMHCLDLGCGSGDVTFDLAHLTGPVGTVVGIDMDEDLLALARLATPAQGVSNVEFRAADVSQWDEQDSYDLVYSRFLLQHLSDPVDLLRRMWRAVRAGGVLAVEDADFGGLFCDPDNDGFDFYRTMYPRVCASNGGDATVGRKLSRYFAEAGIPAPEMRLVQSFGASGDLKALAVATLEASGDEIVAAGLASRDEVATAIADLQAFADTAGTLIGDPRTFQVWASRG